MPIAVIVVGGTGTQSKGQRHLSRLGEILESLEWQPPGLEDAPSLKKLEGWLRKGLLREEKGWAWLLYYIDNKD